MIPDGPIMGVAGATPHIEAGGGDYAETVLLPGDPERAQWMAQTFLEAPRCVNRRRGALAFTGRFRGKPVSIQATGVGVPSFLIYANELLDFHGAGTLIRTGTTRSSYLPLTQFRTENRYALFLELRWFSRPPAGAGPERVPRPLFCVNSLAIFWCRSRP